MQFFLFFISSNFEFSLMNALVYVDIDRGIHKGKLKNALNEKRKKLRGFSFSINMANFEAFRRTKKLISNFFFLKSDRINILEQYPYLYLHIFTFLFLNTQVNVPTHYRIIFGLHQKRHTATFVQNVNIRASFYGEKVMFHHPIYVYVC